MIFGFVEKSPPEFSAFIYFGFHEYIMESDEREYMRVSTPHVLIDALFGHLLNEVTELVEYDRRSKRTLPI